MRTIWLVLLLVLTVTSLRRSRRKRVRYFNRRTRVSHPFNQILTINQKYGDQRLTKYQGQKEKQPKLLEGDMVFDKRLETEIELMKDGMVLFDAANQGQWKDGEVPYRFDTGWRENEKSIVRGAMTEYHTKTCIKFKEQRFSKPTGGYILFIKGKGCYSFVGNQGKEQVVSLPNGCLQKGVVIHELMHALGFFHEQSRNDRDKYIKINTQNIKAGMERQFEKYQPYEASTLGLPYDLRSIMHYNSHAFSKNGRPTIEVRDKKNIGIIGQRRGLSLIDIRQLNRYYGCKSVGVGEGGGKPVGVKPTTSMKPYTTPTKVTVTACRDWNTYKCIRTYARYCKLSGSLGASVRRYCPATCKLCGCQDKISSCTPKDCAKRIYSHSLCRRTCRNC